MGKIAFGLYAAPAYRDKLEAGHAQAFIGYDEESDFIFEAAWLARNFSDKRFAFRANGQVSQAAAARAGYGIALLPRYLAAHDPGLVQVSLGETLPDRDVWLLLRRDLKSVPRIRAVADYFIELFQRERHLLSGD